MNRRTFVRAAAASAGGAALSADPLWAGWRPRADLVFRNALLFDGSGVPPRAADVAVTGDRITSIGAPGTLARGGEEIDLRGLALAPGFIDIHSHTDLALLVDARAESKVRQGVTTEVAGQDGSSIGPWSEAAFQRVREDYRTRYGVDIDFRDLAGFFRRLERQPAAVNLASMVGHGTIRAAVVGEDDRSATPQELARMVGLVREAVQAGACGLSSGLEYTPGAFGSLEELVALAGALRGTGLPYSSHMRNEDDQLFAAVEEAINVGRGAGIPVEVSHLKAQGGRNWWKADPVLETLEQAVRSGVDVRYDVYPYVAYSTNLTNLFPVSSRDGGNAAFLTRLRDPAQRAALEPAVRDKIDELGSWDSVQITSTASDSLAWARGRRLGALAQERGEEPFAFLVRLLLEDRAETGMVGFGMSEENVAKMLAHPLAIVCSDGGARAPYGPLSAGSPHPRNYGAFPRVLGYYVREKRVMPLETAIQKMTSLPAARLRLEGRGSVVQGAFADLVVFDPAMVADRATFEKPHQYPVGIPHVIVNGRFVIRDGEQTGQLPGRVVRPAAAKV